MEYVHAALLLHSAGQDITEDNVTEVAEAAGIDVDESRVKALVASLDGVDIEEAVKKQATAPAPAKEQAPAEKESKEETEEEEEESEEEEEEEVSEEEAASGLGSLFEE